MPPLPATEPGTRKLTYEDYLRFPDDGRRHEILDGVHVVSPAPRDRHQEVLLTLSKLLFDRLRATRQADLRFAPSDVFLGEHDIYQPDLYVVLAEHREGFGGTGFTGVPDLVLEVLSPGNPAYDQVRKLERYEALGVPEYWIVDPLTQRVEVYRREGEAFARPLLLERRRGDRLGTPLLPGLELDLAEVFETWEDTPGA